MCSTTSLAPVPMSPSRVEAEAGAAAKRSWTEPCWLRSERSDSARVWSTGKSSPERTSTLSRAPACVAHNCNGSSKNQHKCECFRMAYKESLTQSLDIKEGQNEKHSTTGVIGGKGLRRNVQGDSGVGGAWWWRTAGVRHAFQVRAYQLGTGNRQH